MVFQSSIIGFSFIIIAWLLQLIYSWKGNRTIKNSFVIVYALGTAWLVIDGYINSMQVLSIFNLINLALACMVMIRMDRVKKSNTKKKR